MEHADLIHLHLHAVREPHLGALHVTGPTSVRRPASQAGLQRTEDMVHLEVVGDTNVPPPRRVETTEVILLRTRARDVLGVQRLGHLPQGTQVHGPVGLQQHHARVDAASLAPLPPLLVLGHLLSAEEAPDVCAVFNQRF